MEKIGNKTDADGRVLCPVCNQGTTWAGQDKGRACQLTSPFVRVQTAAVDALVHRCCALKALLIKAKP